MRLIPSFVIVIMISLFIVNVIEFFTIGVSVRLSDRFNVTQSKINFVKNCPQWGNQDLRIFRPVPYQLS